MPKIRQRKAIEENVESSTDFSIEKNEERMSEEINTKKKEAESERRRNVMRGMFVKKCEILESM